MPYPPTIVCHTSVPLKERSIPPQWHASGKIGKYNSYFITKKSPFIRYCRVKELFLGNLKGEVYVIVLTLSTPKGGRFSLLRRLLGRAESDIHSTSVLRLRVSRDD
jgi:hypothetical protein